MVRKKKIKHNLALREPSGGSGGGCAGVRRCRRGGLVRETAWPNDSVLHGCRKKGGPTNLTYDPPKMSGINYSSVENTSNLASRVSHFGLVNPEQGCLGRRERADIPHTALPLMSTVNELLSERHPCDFVSCFDSINFQQRRSTTNAHHITQTLPDHTEGDLNKNGHLTST